MPNVVPAGGLAGMLAAANALPDLVTELRDVLENSKLSRAKRAKRLQDLVAQIETEREAMRSLAINAPDDLPKAYEVLREMGATTQLHLTGLLYHVERMSFQGLKPAQIADRIGIDPAMLQFLDKKHPDVRAAIVGGAARAADELSAAVMRRI